MPRSKRSGTHTVWSRRALLKALGAGAVSSLLHGCGGTSGGAARVVLYSSADDEILRQVVAGFEKRSRLSVGVVTDTEATKTTGLVQRLLDEKDRPRADVWWSSEPLGTIRLAREGVLAEHTPGPESAGRPEPLNARAGWFAMPGRARVIAYSADRVKEADVPRTPGALAAFTPARVGMARPQFGTTRCHMAALSVSLGEAPFCAWLGDMKSRARVRLYDGNASVVRAIAQAEIDVGLTDTDDVYAAGHNGWKVGMVYEDTGAVVLPNTAGLVARGPNPGGGAVLLDYLLGEEVERLLAAGDSRHIPVRASIAGEFPQNAPSSRASLDYEKIADAAPGAMRCCEDVFGS